MATCKGINSTAYKKAAEKQGDFEISNAKTQAIISAGILAAQILIRNHIAKKTENIQSRQIGIAETLRSQLKQFWDIDKGLLAEACAAKTPATDYSVKDSFSSYVKKAECLETGVACAPVDYCTKSSTALSIAMAKVDAANFGMRYAENRQRALDEQRFSRKFKTFQSMRGMYSGVDRLIDHAGATAGIASLGKMIQAGLYQANWVAEASPIMPKRTGSKEYTWDGGTGVASNTKPFVVSLDREPTNININVPKGGKDEWFDGKNWRDATDTGEK